MDIKLSKHAYARIAQRGIQKTEFSLFWKHADQDVFVPGNCTAISVSKKKRSSLVKNGLSAQTVDRISKLIALVSADGTVVTVMKDRGEKGQIYRNSNSATRH